MFELAQDYKGSQSQDGQYGQHDQRARGRPHSTTWQQPSETRKAQCGETGGSATGSTVKMQVGEVIALRQVLHALRVVQTCVWVRLVGLMAIQAGSLTCGISARLGQVRGRMHHKDTGGQAKLGTRSQAAQVWCW
jgi:hypothetical protein